MDRHQKDFSPGIGHSEDRRIFSCRDEWSAILRRFNALSSRHDKHSHQSIKVSTLEVSGIRQGNIQGVRLPSVMAWLCHHPLHQLLPLHHIFLPLRGVDEEGCLEITRQYEIEDGYAYDPEWSF